MVMVDNDNSDIFRLAARLTSRLVDRGQVSPSLRDVAARYMRLELHRSLSRVAKLTSRNAAMAVMAHRMMG